MKNAITRREILTGSAAMLAAGAVTVPLRAADEAAPAAAAAPPARRGRIKQSIVHWCFAKYWDVEKACTIATQLGCSSIELIGPEHWPTLAKHNLTCAIAGSHGFSRGYSIPEDWAYCSDILTKRLAECKEHGVERVISFTGIPAKPMPRDVAFDNAVKGFRTIVPAAEKAGVTICLEMLNSRATEKMKGHPGYAGDHTDFCIDIIKAVGSPRLKLLFDLYHVQIMDGDVISRIRQHKDYIAHIHTAGVPGRRELDDQQENNYPALMRALIEIGYAGYVGHEFIPTIDPMVGLKQAVELCDI